MRTTVLSTDELPLNELYQIDCRVHWAYEADINDYATWTNSDFSEHGAWLVLHGRAELRDAKRLTYSARANEWIFAPISPSLEQRFGPSSRIISIRFRCRWTDGRPLFDLPKPLILNGARFPDLERTAQRLVSTTAQKFPDLTAQRNARSDTLEHFLRSSAAMNDWIGAWSQALISCGHALSFPQPIDPRVRDAVQWLNANLMQTTFDRNLVARQVFVSPSQLDRLFHNQFGVTPCAYFQQQRLGLARERLTSTVDPIKTIAYAMGFRRVSHFSAWFTRGTGTSARAFRRSKSPAV